MVAFDRNCNGRADDDEWYELAGSEMASLPRSRIMRLRISALMEPTSLFQMLRAC